MKKNSSSLFMYIGVAIASIMLIFSTVSVVLIQGALKKFKSKMEEAGAGIETIVDKFKKAGEKYNEEIDNLKKDVKSLKEGSGSGSSDEAKKEDKKPADAKPAAKDEKKADDKDKKSDSKDTKKDDSAKDKSSSKDKESKDEITFKDDPDAKKS